MVQRDAEPKKEPVARERRRRPCDSGDVPEGVSSASFAHTIGAHHSCDVDGDVVARG
jgi:hypothetical protein